MKKLNHLAEDGDLQAAIYALEDGEWLESVSANQADVEEAHDQLSNHQNRQPQ